MKCKVEYADEINFCPQCGSELVSREAASGGMIGGAYRLVEPIGKGWASTVYRAEHAMMGRPTALKVITSARVADAAFIGRFREAAHLLSDLADEHIATVHDMGIEPPNRIFIATELVNGRSLAATISEDGPVEPHKFLDIVRPIIKGLRAAHVMGVLHGSLKPANIILAADGSGPKLLDFAARRIVAALGDDAFITATPYGPVYGEPSYLAPEQIKGEDTTERTDVYGLGLVMYEMLTGVKAATGKSSTEVAKAQVEKTPPSPRDLKPQLKTPKFIDRAVMRALEKDPAKRQSTAAELFEEFQGEIVPEEAQPEKPVPEKPLPKAPPAARRKTTVAAAPPKPAAAPEPAPPAEAEVPETIMPAGAVFVRYQGKEVVATFPLDKDTMLVGRSPECDIMLDDQGVSRVHARVTTKHGRIIVEDLNSLNGTYINRDAIKRGHIEDGDRVSFGSVDLVFRIGEQE